MRRKDKQIQDPADVEKVLQAATVCFLALQAEPAPYVVPLSFGYADGSFYFHAAGQGRKLDLIRRYPRVGFALAIEKGVVTGERPCNWGMRYRSVVGCGHAVIVDDPLEKVRALDLILAHYGGRPEGYDPVRLAETCVIRLDVEELTGKQSG